MTDAQILYEQIGDTIGGAVKGKLFGKPCLKIGKKAFACFFDNEMVFKLTGDAHANALALDGAQLFDPSGKNRPMKEWVQLPFTHKDQWVDYAEQAMGYVVG